MPNRRRQRPAVVAKEFVDCCDSPWIQCEFIDEVRGCLISCLIGAQYCLC